MIKPLFVAVAAALTLSACGSSNTQADLISDAVKAMESGDYDAVVELCSPSTRLEAATSILVVKAFDPKGTFLKAAAADLKADFADGTIDGGDGKPNDPPVQVDGRWYLNCSS